MSRPSLKKFKDPKLTDGDIRTMVLIQLRAFRKVEVVPVQSYNSVDMKKLSREKIAELCKSIRQEIGYTQRELALELGAGESSIRAWESGLRLPSGDHFLQLLEIRAEKRGINLNGLLN